MRTRIQYQKPARQYDRIAHGSGGRALPARPIQQNNTSATPVTQLYREEGGMNVSEKNRFAVSNAGQENSRMFVGPEVDIDGLNGKLDSKEISFELIDATEEVPLKYGMREVKPNIKQMDKDQIKNIHCGAFSKRLTGKLERVENETAKPGRSLYVDQFEWSKAKGMEEDDNRGSWRNHFASVIANDGGDRGTFETAVHVDHAHFDIYGTKNRGQGFRLKTVLSDIILSVKKGQLSPVKARHLYKEVKKYIETGEPISEDEQLQKELIKIQAVEGQKPDIDEPFKLEAEKQRIATEEKAMLFDMLECQSVDDIYNFINEHEKKLWFKGYWDQFRYNEKVKSNELLQEKWKQCKDRLDGKV